jgi:hypothetical protein
MKYVFISLLLLLNNCSKPKTVLICGDHICVNKAEAQQYFEENLTIEVKIIDKKKKEKINLVELNLKENSNKKKEISISSKNNTSEDLKILSKEEIVEIKKNIKSKNKKKKIVKKVSEKFEVDKNLNSKKKDVEKRNQFKKKNIKVKKNIVYKTSQNVVDVCIIIEKCSIDEISKYLIKQGNNKDFPDITKK